jgi:hypothetical protein
MTPRDDKCANERRGDANSANSPRNSVACCRFTLSKCGHGNIAALCYACSRCNHFKGPNQTSHDPESDQLVRLFNPRIDDWNAHFFIRGAEIVGLTPEGRATVELLQMNEQRRYLLRQMLSEEGQF